MPELRFAFRTFRRSPGFTLLAVLTLSLAIGANTSIYSIVHRVLIEPLVPGAPAPVVNLFNGTGSAQRDYRSFSWAELETLQQPNDVFSAVGAYDLALTGVSHDGGDVQRVFSIYGTGNLLQILDETPVVGRFFAPEETQPGSDIPVVVIGYELWQKLGGTQDVVGRSLRINSRQFEIIGVTRPDISLGNALIGPGLLLPFGVHDRLGNPFATDGSRPLSDPQNHAVMLVGRLQSGLTVETASLRLLALDERLAAIDTDPVPTGRQLEIQIPSRLSISSTPSDDGPLEVVGMLMLGMSGVVLLIACINLANMLLARGASRRKEMAIRLSLGAPRWRLIRQLLLEGFLLSLAGGVGGFIISLWSTDLLLHSMKGMFSTMNFSLIIDSAPDWPLVAATLAFCLIATVLFSLAPAVKISRPDVTNDLKAQDNESTATGRWNRFFSIRHCLVMGQIALSLVMLFSAALFCRGAINATGLDIGFETDGSVVAELDYSLGDLPERDALSHFLRVRDTLREQPTTRHAAITNLLPYGQVTNTMRLVDAARPVDTANDPDAPAPGFSGLNTAISDGFFDSLGVPLIRGRDFTAAEVSDPEATPVVIIDERMAQSLFPEGDALGRRVRRTSARPDGTNPEMEIVGICASFRHQVSSSDAMRRVFLPLAQTTTSNGFLVVQGRLPSREATVALAGSVRETIRRADPAAPLLQLIPLSDHVDRNVGLWITRLGAALFGIFAFIALLIAIIGVYGVKAYAVARRSREIGIRMALGAKPRDIFSLIMNQGTAQTAVGLTVGLLFSVAVGQLLSGLLFRVSPFDPIGLGVSSLSLAAASLTACFLPARRATRVDPMVALRAE